ncbi:hypothetical protein [Candidatus Paracaedibacter symbiosus]|uniref:hypothetical protein n=1 Tax=Candidatus Paracaedibacter symbiosus TaxID=244582 RepID=UPI0018DBD21F|nr:hypothetical protein [Candidatus Paracaedibacter symbiosus]
MLKENEFNELVLPHLMTGARGPPFKNPILSDLQLYLENHAYGMPVERAAY